MEKLRALVGMGFISFFILSKAFAGASVFVESFVAGDASLKVQAQVVSTQIQNAVKADAALGLGAKGAGITVSGKVFKAGADIVMVAKVSNPAKKKVVGETVTVKSATQVATGAKSLANKVVQAIKKAL